MGTACPSRCSDSDRPYRAGMPITKAAGILREGRGVQWDAAVVDAFLHYLEENYPAVNAEAAAAEVANSLATAA